MAATKSIQDVGEKSEGTGEPKKPSGRKGGTEYPRIPLATALEYAAKLVSKTHTGPQPASTVLAGVFNSATGAGKIRAASLRKYGLLEGEKEGYSATKLAREISGAADEGERTTLLRKAMMSDKVFRLLFETFHGDMVTKAKLRQRAQVLKVHPDQSDQCVDYFIQSAETAKLGTRDGDGIRLIASSEISLPPQDDLLDDSDVDENVPPDSEENPEDQRNPDDKSEKGNSQLNSANEDLGKSPLPRPRTAADVNVSLTVDSSLDGDKLEKQLAALRRYGLI
jgi:hypothetical protein